METKGKTGKKDFISAACIMGITAIGPGFLVQTSQFTSDFNSSFGFVIIASVIIAIICQINVWRVICVSGKRGQEIANEILPGSGYVLSVLIVLGALIFNIGNIGGGALGITTLTGISVKGSTVIVCLFSIVIYLMKNATLVIDRLSRVLCTIMIGVIGIMIFLTEPPASQAVIHTFMPDGNLKEYVPAIVTLIGGTIGGYVTFTGAHRLVDSGIKGMVNINEIQRSSVVGILITTFVRVLLFLAVLGVVSKGVVLDPSNPAVNAFSLGAGNTGYIFAGVVMVAASLTPISSAAYTSVSFIKTFHPFIEKNENYFIILSIVISGMVMFLLGKPADLLIIASSLNSLILPVVLVLCLAGARSSKIMGENYRHPFILTLLGIIVAIALFYFGITSCIIQIKGII